MGYPAPRLRDGGDFVAIDFQTVVAMYRSEIEHKGDESRRHGWTVTLEAAGEPERFSRRERGRVQRGLR